MSDHLSRAAASEANIQEAADAMYAALEGHYWLSGRCACGWTKPAHSIGHKHHLAYLLAQSGFALYPCRDCPISPGKI